MEGSQSTKRLSTSPMMKRYLSSMKEITDNVWKDSNSATSQNGLTTSSRKSFEGSQPLQGRLRDISSSNRLSTKSKKTKS